MVSQYQPNVFMLLAFFMVALLVTQGRADHLPFSPHPHRLWERKPLPPPQHVPALALNSPAAPQAAAPAPAPAPAQGSAPVTYVPGYPVPDKVPPTDSPEVKEWLKLVDFSKVPNIPLSSQGQCPATPDPNSCWWTCQKCTRPDDIVTCPNKGQWGLTYDDGPSVNSVPLLDYLKQQNIKATMFVVGSRVIYNGDLLRREYQEGHHIAVHTWSHSPMTSLTNEQIVAEIKWTEKAIKDAIGVTPVYFRPPYGDYDDRVRAIVRQLGYKTVIWTEGFDTQDWQLVSKQITPEQALNNFRQWIPRFQQMASGFIVLEHDLYKESVEVAVNGILPLARQSQINMMTIPQCLGDNAPYRELAGQSAAGSPGAGAGSSPATNQTSDAPGATAGSSIFSAASSWRGAGGAWMPLFVACGLSWWFL
ncbi:uncharacterized protein VTP21DRAFT_1449 [Calcarisporiella thermophila]|uniref:uncharacterized protein n=1 Tax=Calcarisporiella thermophila TaxID=911321 RepID=UPI003741EFED